MITPLVETANECKDHVTPHTVLLSVELQPDSVKGVREKKISFSPIFSSVIFKFGHLEDWMSINLEIFFQIFPTRNLISTEFSNKLTALQVSKNVNFRLFCFSLKSKFTCERIDKYLWNTSHLFTKDLHDKRIHPSSVERSEKSKENGEKTKSAYAKVLELKSFPLFEGLKAATLRSSLVVHLKLSTSLYMWLNFK